MIRAIQAIDNGIRAVDRILGPVVIGGGLAVSLFFVPPNDFEVLEICSKIIRVQKQYVNQPDPLVSDSGFGDLMTEELKLERIEALRDQKIAQFVRQTETAPQIQANVISRL